MILAAGKGERMRPLTLETPKPLLPAGGKPLIVHHIESLVRAGVTDLVINPSWLGDKLEATLGDGQAYGAHITYSREPQPLETAGGIRQALPLLADSVNGWFVVINGDIWTDFDLSQLLDQATLPSLPTYQAMLVLTDNPHHHPQGDFHLTATGRVTRTGASRLTFAGISLLHQSLFASLAPGYRKLAPVLEQAMDKDRVAGIYHSGRWFDIGTPERLDQLDAQLREQTPDSTTFNSTNPNRTGKA
jgi:MurNAc alpha-1-phosphate uridylyltransferase